MTSCTCQQAHSLKLFALQMRLANRCNNYVCKLRLSTKVYNGWLVHSHTISYLYWEQCMGGLTGSLRLFIAMQDLSSLNLMNCTCCVVTLLPYCVHCGNLTRSLCAGQSTHYLISPVTFL